jgi:endonuclease/exonuclease/phosphatase family metal-dependent hydrolase
MMRLDRIYASRDLAIRSAWTDRKAGAYSDHLPVIADIGLPE